MNPSDLPPGVRDALRGDDAATLAALARAFERRVDGLAEHVDASWAKTAGWRALLRDLPPGAARRRVAQRMFVRACGPLPALAELTPPVARLALLDRLPLLTRLCALALVARPGALRCCVERQARRALEEALGPVLQALRESGRGGAPVSAEVAAWSPMQWACAGYLDLVHARCWPQQGLRRLVRLALPEALPVPPAAVPAPQLGADAALRQVDALFQGAARC